ncbi:hypothetical protein [Streptomyces sp. I05A-00742]|uniref:hypothetical protein n=1 Tax=Streptomyces sp. I05A-00742 TaxID=2732853 RepID=UPI001487F4EC|nr:hypothetical protein [Streptomyces sp. I05A-00742]
MSRRRVASRLVFAAALVLGATGLSQEGPGVGSHAAARTLEPACPPPGGGTCYFEWFDSVGRRSVELDPEVGVCRNMTSAGAVRGTNMTNRTVNLWPSSDCFGNPTALVAAGRSWNDPSHTYFSFRPVP